MQHTTANSPEKGADPLKLNSIPGLTTQAGKAVMCTQ
jgi:hypothetical protein